ncbi:flagellar biosynthesis protein FlhF [Kaarinaea lacus]
MRTRRYFSNDLRSAVLTVRDELGSNAVILSHKKSEHGVEVVAAVSLEPHTPDSPVVTYQSNLLKSAVFLNTDKNFDAADRDPRPEHVYFFKTGTGAQNELKDQISNLNGNDSCTREQCMKQVSIGDNCRKDKPDGMDRPINSRVTKKQISLSQRVMDRLSMNKVVEKEEHTECVQDTDSPVATNQQGLNNLMALIEQQITEHAWGEMARRNPLRARLIRQLLKLDIHPLIIQRITDALSGNDLDTKSLMPHALALLANQLPVYQEDITACGGTVALFGATGAGKTTTVAKMAARYALRHGREKVALITTDNQRIAAHEQLRIYSEILGIPLKMASDADELMDALNVFSEKSFVLIDTAGMGPKDIQVSNCYQLFSGVLSQIRSFLVLPTTAHHSVLEQSANAFRSIKLDGCIFTKLDEAASLGSPLSVAILNNLPVAYYSNGQKIPDDFHLARAHNLVSRAVGVKDQFVETQSVKARSQDKAGIEANVSI